MDVDRNHSDLFNSSIDGIFSLDQDFRITSWNRQMERFSGLKNTNTVGKPAMDLFPLLRFQKQELQKVLKGKICIIKGMPFNAALNNGMEEYYEGYYTPVKNEDKEITGVLGIIRELGYRASASAKSPGPASNEWSGGRSTDLDTENIIFEDLINLEDAQKLQDALASAFGVASVIIDPRGAMLTRPSGFAGLCLDLVRRTEEGLKLCKKSMADAGEDGLHNCQACGLRQTATSIEVGGKLLAKWVIGHVKTEITDADAGKKMAGKLGLDEIEYLEGLDKAPYISSKNFARAADLHREFTGQLLRTATENLKKDQELSHRKRIESQLINITNRREELARIINKSPAIAFLWKLDQKRPVSFVSENINQFGYTQEEFHSGKLSYSDVVFGDDRTTLQEKLQQYIALGGEENFNSEYRIVTKHGGVRWVTERSWPRRDLGNQTEYLEGLLVDITVRKFAEEALAASEEHFKLLFERAPIGMALLSTEGDITRVNKSFCDSAGYEPEELVNTKFIRIIHDGDKEAFTAEEKKLLAGDVTEYQLENRFIKKNGDAIYSITKVAMILDAKGQPVQQLVQIVDITNRKKAENDLIASQNKLHQAQSFAHLGNWELDLATNRIVATDEVYKIYGYAEIPEGVSLKDFLDPITPDYADSVKKRFKAFLKGEKPDFSEEYKIVRGADGKIIAVQTKAELVYGSNNEPKMALGTIQDITDRKEIEDELKTRNHELTNFVYKVSHDLRSPLLSISGLLSIMRQQEANPESANYIDMIEGRVKRLDTFIMDILSHSKNLYMDVAVDKIDFEKIIDKCFNDLAYLDNALKVKRNVSIASGEFYSDYQRLTDIFRNLISNAVLYLHPSKKENILNIDVNISEKYASIVIEDNGLGIEKDVLPRIFDMFYRGIEISSGSGIGLYIVKQAVEKLGGNISVESSRSVGTKFFVTLPNLKHPVKRQESAE